MTAAPRPRTTRLLLTIDVERDYGPNWDTQSDVTYRSVREAIPAILAPLCAATGMRPTYFVSPEVLCDPASVRVLREQPDAELAAHLHAEYVSSGLPRSQWTNPDNRILAMQKDLGRTGEAAALAELTELFAQQFAQRPASFRAGRFGISEDTGSSLCDLGYRADSSVTPGVVWTDPAGRPAPDFRGLPHRAYRPQQGGNLLQPAAAGTATAPLLEVPVTVVPGATIGSSKDVVWLRPFQSTREEMLAILDAAAHDEDRGQAWGSLCIMFHSMELIAGASPYTETEADVQRFVDDLRAVAEHARALGFLGRTVAEFEHECTRQQDAATKQAEASHTITQEQWTVDSPNANQWRVAYQRPTGEPLDVEAILKQHRVQPWHAYSLNSRPERWDNATAWQWLAQLLPQQAAVLDVGCGVGGNLQWLFERGFTDLSGCDLDRKAVRAARELADGTNSPAHFWVDNGCRLLATPQRRYDALVAMNWVSLVDGFELSTFLKRVRSLLTDTGVFVIDYIDRDFDRNPNHRYLSSDVNKPEAERAESEYRTRFSATEIRNELQRYGFEVCEETRIDGPIPRGVLMCRRVTAPSTMPRPANKSSVLYIVDAPGWAHDHKSNNLTRCLDSRFAGKIVYQDRVIAADLDAADAIVIWYWRQLQSMANLGEALTRNRHKLAMGVCSHNELEDEHREPGLSILRQLPARVFTHSELLEQDVRPLVPDSESICLPNGVDADFYRPTSEQRPDRPLRIGWAGSLDNFGSVMRGVSTIIEPAVAHLQEQFPGAFEFVLAAREDRMRSKEEMRTFYQGIDVYVCASRVEGTPNPALEAAACGVPVISTRVGNMPELLEHGRNGLLIERTPTALAAALMLLQQRPELRAAMGQRIRESIERNWQWQSRAQGFAAMFESMLASNVTSTPTQVPQPAGAV